MATTKITDHVAAAQDQLPSQMQGKANIATLLSILVKPAQAVEDALWDLFTLRTIEIGTGSVLDSIGAIIGQQRQGMLDEDYRRYLRARVIANRATGRIEDLLAVSRLVINDEDAGLIIFNLGMAGVMMRIEDVVLDESLISVLVQFLRSVADGGVRVLLEYLVEAEEDSFTLAIAAFTSGSLSPGATTINVGSTEGFPASGTLDIDIGLASEEQRAYTGRTATSFTGVTALGQSHAAGAAVQLANGPGLGLGDTGDPDVGGAFASVRDGG